MQGFTSCYNDKRAVLEVNKSTSQIPRKWKFTTLLLVFLLCEYFGKELNEQRARATKRCPGLN